MRELGADDRLVTFHPTPATRRKDPWLPTEITARLIRDQAPGFRPSWSITSPMDVEAYTREEWVDLYHRRWRIEIYQSYCLHCHRFYDDSGLRFGLVRAAA
jgi:hypothetical protein